MYSAFSGIAVTLVTWVALSIGAYRALQLQHSKPCVSWWLPAAAGVLAQLAAFALYPAANSHIAGYFQTIWITLVVIVGLVLPKVSNLLLDRAYRSGKDLRESPP